jgi:hypothetical protein
VNKRTIQPAAGDSRVSAAAAKSAARYVRRDSRTGRFVMSLDDVVIRSADRVRVYQIKGDRKKTTSIGASTKRDLSQTSKKR